MKRYTTAILFSIMLVLPVISLMSLLHEVIGHAHLPVELIHSTFGLAITNAVLFAEQAFIMVPYFLWGVLVGARSYVRLSPSALPTRGIRIGFFFGLPLMLIVVILAPTSTQSLLGFLLLGLLFAGWGMSYIYAYHKLQAVLVQRKRQENLDLVQKPVDRRRFLMGLGATTALLTIGTGALGTRLHLTRRELLGDKFNLHPSLPRQLRANLYLISDDFQYPEQRYARYQPAKHPIGVCFGSGGPRAASLAAGQMRGLIALGLLEQIGAISCVSGGSWLGTIFTYAPQEIDDATLLGSYFTPEQITLEKLSQLNPQMIAAPISQITDNKMLKATRDIMRGLVLSDTAPFNRFFSRLLNEMLLKPFGLDDLHSFFTINDEMIADILARNPSLKAYHFYTARPNRPFLICGSTHVYPPGAEKRLYPFEFTPLYSGIAPLFEGKGYEGTDFGGGYIETFAFDSTAPLEVDSTGLVMVSTPEPIMLLSDMVGSTSAAPGVILNHYNVPELMPEFNLWPLKENDEKEAFAYSIVDGANLEQNGIVPLLLRHYPIILAFISAIAPLGIEGDAMVNGIPQQISRLFGFLPPVVIHNKENTQVFPSKQFEPLATALKSALEEGRAPIHVDSYEIVQPNFFNIRPYPGNGKVTVVWVYNDMNWGWHDKLPPEIQTLLKSNEPTNRMDNFPHFKTTAQNQTDDGLPQILQYTPEQINLLAHMSCYTVMHDAKQILLSLTS